MLAAPPEPSPYDWNFQFFPFPVRVSWTFWLVAAAFGYQSALGLNNSYMANHLTTPGHAVLLLIWMGTTFLSIFIHEVGHCVAFLAFGIPSRILLYHTGGLAIPEGFTSWRGARLRSPTPAMQLIISLAGPVAQLLFAALVAAIAIAIGYQPGFMGSYLIFKSGLPVPGELPDNAAIMALIDFSITPSIFWALINLVPVLPLDGGQVARSLIGMFSRRSDGHQEALIVSAVVGGIVGLLGLQAQQPFLGLMFIILAIGSFQELQSRRGGW